MPSQHIENRSSGAHPPVRALDGLTSLRIVPAIYVLAFHYATMFFGDSKLPPGLDIGYSGVTFFFVLSGFILSYNYVSVDLTQADAKGRYIMARCARIYPVFIFSIIISLPLFFSAIPPLDNFVRWITTAARILLTVLGLHAWVPGAACAINCPSWSISAEFFFYAVFPLLLPAVMRDPRKSFVVTVALLCLSWCIFGILWHLLGQGLALTSPETHDRAITNLAAQFVLYFPLGRTPEFVLGILLYVAWSRSAKTHSAAFPIAVAVLAGAALVLAQPILPDVALSNGLTSIVWAPLIWAVASLKSSILSSGALLLLGRISFAIYLIHVPVGSALLLADATWMHKSASIHPWVFATSATALTIAIAAFIFSFVEEPARRYLLALSKRESFAQNTA